MRQRFSCFGQKHFGGLSFQCYGWIGRFYFCCGHERHVWKWIVTPCHCVGPHGDWVGEWSWVTRTTIKKMDPFLSLGVVFSCLHMPYVCPCERICSLPDSFSRDTNDSITNPPPPMPAVPVILYRCCCCLLVVDHLRSS